MLILVPGEMICLLHVSAVRLVYIDVIGVISMCCGLIPYMVLVHKTPVGVVGGLIAAMCTFPLLDFISGDVWSRSLLGCRRFGA